MDRAVKRNVKKDKKYLGDITKIAIALKIDSGQKNITSVQLKGTAEYTVSSSLILKFSQSLGFPCPAFSSNGFTCYIKYSFSCSSRLLALMS